MRIDILTVVPELLTSPLHESILKRAQEKGLVEIVVHNLHDYAHDKRKTTDDCQRSKTSSSSAATTKASTTASANTS